MARGDHYFAREPRSASAPFEIMVEVRGLHLTLLTDRGVFAKGRPDPGTLLLARTVELPPRGRILDLGCGYGLLGIVAAILSPEAMVTLVDVNVRAAELARANCERLRLANAEVLEGDARQVLGARRFDAILFNPPYRAGKAQVMGLIGDAAARLTDGGALWVVGRTKQGIKTLARDAAPLFGSVDTAEIKSGYRVIVCRAGQMNERTNSGAT